MAATKLTLELWDSPELQRCPDCGGWRKFFSGEVLLDDGGTLAVFMTFLYEHGGEREVFTDAVFGTWGPDADDSDHETFGSRTGPIESSPHDVSSLITGGSNDPEDASVLGLRLTREQALEHPLLPAFWQVNDLVLTEIAASPDSWAGVGSRRPRRPLRRRPRR